MALHHKIQPHHHVSLWAIALLVLVTSGLSYADALVAQAESGGQHGPSASTKKFFGDSEDSGSSDSHTPPQICLDEIAAKKEQATKDAQKLKELEDQSRSLLSEGRDNDSSPSPSASSGSSEDDEEEHTTSPSPSASSDDSNKEDKKHKIEQQIEELRKSQPKGDRFEMSSACKKATVQKEAVSMKKFRTKIKDNIIPSFSKVDNIITKVEKIIPTLKEAGVEESKITEITSEVNSIKKNSVILKAFMQKMLSSMDDFVSKADSNPDGAFTSMGSGFGGDDSKNAATAADSLVKSFEKLQDLIAELAK